MPDMAARLRTLQDQGIRPPCDYIVCQGGCGGETNDPGAAPLGLFNFIFFRYPAGKDNKRASQLADKLKLTFVNRGQRDQIDAERPVGQLFGFNYLRFKNIQRGIAAG